MNVVAFDTATTVGSNLVLDRIADNIREGHIQAIKGGDEWVEGSIKVAMALREARVAMPAHYTFSGWLKERQLDFYNRNDRAALINLAENPELTRSILKQTKSRNFENIWRENRRRFQKDLKTTAPRIKPRPPRRQGRAMLYRRMKLGEAVFESLKGTSLDSANELDELVALNRGAPEGHLTPIVKRLVDDAVAGKNVSALAETAKLGTMTRKKPTLVEAWRKRMVYAWEQASRSEQTSFVEYLMNQIKDGDP